MAPLLLPLPPAISMTQTRKVMSRGSVAVGRQELEIAGAERAGDAHERRADDEGLQAEPFDILADGAR